MNRNREAGPVDIDARHQILCARVMSIDRFTQYDVEAVNHVIDVIALKRYHISRYQLSKPPALKG